MTITTLLLAAALSQTPQVAPDAAAPAKFAPKSTVYGFLNLQLETKNEPGPKDATSNASLKRARLGVKGQVTPVVGYNLNFEIGPTSQGLKDAFASLKVLPGAEIRLGQQKTPFGYEIPESDTKLLWVNNAYVTATLARGPSSRDIGVGAFGKWTVTGPLAVELAAAGVNGAGENKADDLDEKNAWARGGVVVKALGATAKVGGSYGYGHQVKDVGLDKTFGGTDDTYFYFSTYGADVQLDSPYVFAVAEYIASTRDQTALAGATVTRGETDLSGWYLAAVGKTPWNAGPVVRYDVFDANTASASENDVQKRLTLGAYYDVESINARFIANYELDASEKNVTASKRADVFTLFGQVMF